LPLKEKDMTESRQILSAPDALRFALAGNARLTLVSKKTRQRFTYRVRQSVDNDSPTKKGDVHFVQVLTGADNTQDFTFLGTIFKDRSFRHGRRSRISRDAGSARAWAWFWPQLAKGHLPEAVELWHEGRCGRCGRALTVPESIERGIGPECASLMGISVTEVGGVGPLPQLALGPEFLGPGPGLRGVPARLAGGAQL
jgi:hypothetical protein